MKANGSANPHGFGLVASEKRSPIAAVLLAAASLAALAAHAAPQPEPAAAATNAVPYTMVPKKSNESRQRDFIAAYRKAPEHPVILFGDSLTDNWRSGTNFACMSDHFQAVNAGICGDTIEGVLWRLMDMEAVLKTNPPRVATFMIGTNNFRDGTTDDDLFLGMKNLVEVLRGYCPDTKIIVFGIPPRAMPWRRKALPYTATINRRYRTLADNEHVFFFDVSPYLVDPKTGEVRAELYSGDMLHFSAKGYAEVFTPCYAGMIRLVTSDKLPDGFFRRNALWKDYLLDRISKAEGLHQTEEYLRNDHHLSTLPDYWFGEFARLEKDPGAVPRMPEEYLRQGREEGLPDFLK